MDQDLPRWVWKLIRRAHCSDGGGDDGGSSDDAGGPAGGPAGGGPAGGGPAGGGPAGGGPADGGPTGGPTGGSTGAFGAGATDMSSATAGVTGAAATGDQGQSGAGFGPGGFGGDQGFGGPAGGGFGAGASDQSGAAAGVTGAAAGAGAAAGEGATGATGGGGFGGSPTDGIFGAADLAGLGFTDPSNPNPSNPGFLGPDPSIETQSLAEALGINDIASFTSPFGAPPDAPAGPFTSSPVGTTAQEFASSLAAQLGISGFAAPNTTQGIDVAAIAAGVAPGIFDSPAPPDAPAAPAGPTGVTAQDIADLTGMTVDEATAFISPSGVVDWAGIEHAVQAMESPQVPQDVSPAPPGQPGAQSPPGSSLVQGGVNAGGSDILQPGGGLFTSLGVSPGVSGVAGAPGGVELATGQVVPEPNPEIGGVTGIDFVQPGGGLFTSLPGQGGVVPGVTATGPLGGVVALPGGPEPNPAIATLQAALGANGGIAPTTVTDFGGIDLTGGIAPDVAGGSQPAFQSLIAQLQGAGIDTSNPLIMQLIQAIIGGLGLTLPPSPFPPGVGDVNSGPGGFGPGIPGDLSSYIAQPGGGQIPTAYPNNRGVGGFGPNKPDDLIFPIE